MATEKRCLLCGSYHNITFHHLIPKYCHSNKWFKKRYSTQQMRELNTLEKICSNEAITNYVVWAKKNS